MQQISNQLNFIAYTTHLNYCNNHFSACAESLVKL